MSPIFSCEWMEMQMQPLDPWRYKSDIIRPNTPVRLDQHMTQQS